MNAPAVTTTEAEDWIVCLGEERVVRDGAVSCPRLAGRLASVQQCLDCHLLMLRRDERSAASSCDVEAWGR